MTGVAKMCQNVYTFLADPVSGNYLHQNVLVVCVWSFNNNPLREGFLEFRALDTSAGCAL